jgi:hypothetical protein
MKPALLSREIMKPGLGIRLEKFASDKGVIEGSVKKRILQYPLRPSGWKRSTVQGTEFCSLLQEITMGFLKVDSFFFLSFLATEAVIEVCTTSSVEH